MDNDDHWNESTAPLLINDDITATITTSPLEINDCPSNPRHLPTVCLIVTPIVILIPVLFLLAFFLPHGEHRAFSGKNQHQLPAASTVFQFVTEQGRPINSRHNKLYEELKHGSFADAYTLGNDKTHLTDFAYGKATSATPFSLQLSHEQVQFGQELELTWHYDDRHNDATDAFRDHQNIIVALSCADNLDSVNNIAKNLVDAATLAEIRTTHLLHNKKAEVTGKDNAWIIPSFPIIHSNLCLFSMMKEYAHGNYGILAQQHMSLESSQDLPTSIHLGLSSDPDSRYIQFTTGIVGTPIVEIARRSLVDPQAELTFMKLTGKSSTYTAEDMCQFPANDTDGAGRFVNPGHLHTVKVENLELNSIYVYRAGLAMGQGVRWSEYLEFKTDAVGGNGEDKAVTTFLAFGDQGCEQSLDTSNTPAVAPSFTLSKFDVREGQAAAQDVVSLILSIVNNETISSIHHLGDLAYADGAGHLWDRYMNMIQAYASRVPVIVGVGNHEYDHTEGGEGKDPSGVGCAGGFQPYWGNFDDASGGECGVPLSSRFAGPENGNGVFWYSFNQPLVHTIMLSTEHNLTAGSAQYNWLQQDLQTVNRTITPWLFIEMHRPIYDMFQEDDAIAVAMEYEIEDLLYEYNVDVVLSGHFHSYLRSCDGLFRGKCDNGGPIYITVGTGGAPLDGESHGNLPWVEKYVGTQWGVGKVSIFDATKLRWEFVAVGKDVTDEHVIIRHRD